MWSYRLVSLRSIVNNNFQSLIIGLLLFTGLYLTSLYSYLLFHTLAEGFSIVIAVYPLPDSLEHTSTYSK